MTIRFFNSLSGKLEILRVKAPLTLNWYSCGPTVYDVPHIGHARTFVTQDIIRRILERYGAFNVNMQMGITDIDDKIIDRSVFENACWKSIGSKYTQEFLKTLSVLNVKFPSGFSRVSENISAIVEFAETLLKNGLAYRAPSGSIYFSVDAYESSGFKYGKFKCQQKDFPSMSEREEKRNGRDFALWKARKSPTEPSFDFFGAPGRPGWHIECSAMGMQTISTNLLNGVVHSGINQIDLHSGGVDLKFPHHENEIALSEAFYQNSPWCSQFIHIGHVKIGNEKMSKSLKNYVAVNEFLQEESAETLRMMCLLKPYREDFEFNEDMIRTAKLSLRRIEIGLNTLEKRLRVAEYDQICFNADSNWKMLWSEIKGNLLNDFSTPKAFGLILHWLSRADEHDPVSIHHSLHDIKDLLLSLGFAGYRSDYLAELVEFRRSVRKFALGQGGKIELLELCDKVRNEFNRKGIVINDDKL